MLNNFANCDFFTKLVKMHLSIYKVGIISDIFYGIHSKVEAKAIYVVKQACGHDI